MLMAQEVTELVELMERQVQQLLRLVEDLLDVTRIQAGHLELHPQAVDLRRLATDAAKLFSSVSAKHEVRVEVPAAEVICDCDPNRLGQVLNNLLSNAIKYSPGGGRIEFRGRVAANEAEFEVNDYGIGIPEEDQARLFETFHRARNVGNIAGTGLGLAIVKKSLDLHGGRVSVESKPEMGTRFRVTIPLAK